MTQPRLIMIKATPSVLQVNFSLRIIGASMALKTIVKHEVEEIKMMLPNARAAPLNA